MRRRDGTWGRLPERPFAGFTIGSQLYAVDRDGGVHEVTRGVPPVAGGGSPQLVGHVYSAPADASAEPEPVADVMPEIPVGGNHWCSGSALSAERVIGRDGTGLWFDTDTSGHVFATDSEVLVMGGDRSVATVWPADGPG